MMISDETARALWGVTLPKISESRHPLGVALAQGSVRSEGENRGEQDVVWLNS
jgi:hypothetical protein